MKNIFVLHPFLFGVFPILFLYSNNLDEVSILQMIVPFFIIIFLIIILQLALTLLLKNKHIKALIISLWMVFFFSFGIFYNLVYHIFSRKTFPTINSFLIYIWLAVFIFCLLLIIRIKNPLIKLTKYLNIVSVILLLFVFFDISSYKLNSAYTYSKNPLEFTEMEYDSLDHFKKENLPNIYYIISDGYGSSATLKKEYGYDNSDFENFLEQNGFYIAKNSCSNYAETMLSFASSLNMEHINQLDGAVRFSMLYSMIQENNVMRLLKSVGYTTIDISSNIGKLQHVRAANLNINPGSFLADEFHSTLIEISMLKAFKKQLNFVYFYREKILNTFTDLSKINSKIDPPFFVFAHILPPHPPYVFGPHAEPLWGSLNLNDWGEMWEQKEYYRDQVIFVNNKLKKVIHNILSESTKDPIIIIQGDHGPQLKNKHKIMARMHIFNAIHLPGKNKNILYDSITPVNTFRVIFNHYFHTHFNLLEDKSYYTEYKIPYNFVDVTSIVAHNY